MFESSFSLAVVPWAAESENLDKKYYECWQGLKSHFNLGEP